MDFPVHVLAGSVIGNIILHHATKYPSHVMEKHRQIQAGAAGFLWGVLSHLFLDALPHYDWLFKLDIFRPLPFYWMYPQILTTLPVIVITFYLTRDYWQIAGAAMLGGMYPDIEKLLYFDFHLPRSFVLFPWHSCRLSQSLWEDEHKLFLIFFEICLFAVMMTYLFWIARQRESSMTMADTPACALHAGRRPA